MILGVWAVCEMRIHAGAAPIGGIGTDVIVGDIPDIRKWGSSGGESSFSVATTSCNIGDQPLTWIANSPLHPAISQNLYRVKDGRIEQLGQSWLKHGFFALQGSLCSTCTPNPNGSALGVGCSDPYGASLNGQQSPFGDGTGGLGPRSEVNAATGVFTWPPRRLSGAEQGLFGGRIRVANSDLEPALNSGARYFVASHYAHPEDSQAGNNSNSTSYREAFVSGTGNSVDVNVGSAQTVRMQPAINAWQAVHSDVELFAVDIPNDGRVVVGVRTTSNGKGYHTEVAIENQTSHQSVRGLEIDHCSGSTMNPGFNDVDYHAENYSGADWTPTMNGSTIEWDTETFAQNQNANAIRWGTLYSFWYDSDAQPSSLTLHFFRSGTISEHTIELDVEVVLGDLNGDGVVNLLDVDPFVNAVGNGIYSCEGDVNEDGVINLLDVEPFIAILSGG